MPAPSIQSLTVDELTRLLRQSGSREASAELIRAHLSQGAPVNFDGTINFIRYLAWLLTQPN